ncbi:type II toxin-antitoxin system ParD family antitoxin [Rhizobium puerariae]|uniref:Type II toxin-antitoxin system ParD family antitoxin n=1 Tax=Rhizobium puerariae TaxID=1585791 RepID=A0ABV6ARD6_9HYPH
MTLLFKGSSGYGILAKSCQHDRCVTWDRLMGKMTSITVDEELTEFIDRQVGEGHYSSASEVVEAALRLLRDSEAGIEAVRAAIEEGEASDEPRPFDFDEFIAKKRALRRQR